MLTTILPPENLIYQTLLIVGFGVLVAVMVAGFVGILVVVVVVIDSVPSR